MSDLAVADPPVVTDRNAMRASLAGGVGSFVEWYDYGLYGLASALYITPLFFAHSSAFVGSLLTFATFAVGFAARPIGGFVLGHFGDRYGRRPVLIFTLVLMSLSTVLMGCLPTTSSIGVLAPVLLVLLRILQGFGAGAELAGAFVYVTESSRPAKQGLYSSVSTAAIPVGSVLATALYLLLQRNLTDQQMLSYGWRVPFWLSAVALAVGVIVRSRVPESAEYLRQRAQAAGERVSRTPVLEVFRADPRCFVAALLAPTIIGVGAYVTSVFGVNFVTTTLSVDKSVGLRAVFVLSIASIITVLMAGRLTDHFSSQGVFLVGAVFFIVFAFPFFWLLETRNPWLITLALTANYAIGWGACAGAQGKLLPALFPTRHRYSGVAVTRELNSAALAGPAPLIAVALVGVLDGQPWLVAVLLIVGGLLSVAGVVLARERDESVPVPAAAR